MKNRLWDIFLVIVFGIWVCCACSWGAMLAIRHYTVQLYRRIKFSKQRKEEADETIAWHDAM